MPIARSECQELALRASQRTVADALTSSATRRPTAVALRAGQVVVSYQELEAEADRIAAALAALQAEPGRPVIVLSENSLQYVLLMFGAARAGVPIAHLNWRHGPDELAESLKVLQPRVAFVQAAYLGSVTEAAMRCGVRLESLITLGTGPAAPAAGNDGAWEWRDFVELGTGRRHRPDVHPETCLHIVLTSGSTGQPKAAMISHRAMLARAAVIAGDIGVTADDAFVAWSPLYHVAASDYTYITAILGGTTFVLPGFDAAGIADIVAAHRIGWLMAIPGTIRALIEACKKRAAPGDWSPRMRAVGVMPDLVPPDEIAELTSLVHAPFVNSYGTTESGLQPTAVANLAEGVIPVDLSKPQSAMCDVRITDSSGADVPAGVPGEMLLRGPTLFSGYFNRPDDDAAAFAGGWWHSGDMVLREPNGNLTFVERKSYMIKSGGENIYPSEIERVLSGHERLTQVAVVRARSERWGQTPVAFVAVTQPAPTAQELKEWCAARLSRFKVPSSFRFIAAADFPRNVSGKVDRRELEKRLLADGNEKRSRQ